MIGYDGLKPALGARASSRTHSYAEPALQSRNNTRGRQ